VHTTVRICAYLPMVKHKYSMIIKILTAPLVAYMLTFPAIIIVQTVMGKTWIRDTLNDSAISIWLVLTGILVIAIIVHYFLKGKQ